MPNETTKNLLSLLHEIKDPRQEILIQIYHDHAPLFQKAEGSSHNHQNWVGGYVDHIAECLRINNVTYNALSQIRPLDFKKDSAAIVLFFHDIEKPFKYGSNEDSRCQKWQKKYSSATACWENAKWEILHEMMHHYQFSFSDEELNALKYTHGEGNDHRKNARVSGPLAAHVHHCDNTSARIWFNEGEKLAA